VQGKRAWPREHLTTAQVDALLTGQDVKRGHGAELLDASNSLIEDLGGDVGVWSVNYSSGEGEAVHGKLTIPLARELDWGTARVRPYTTLSRVTGYEDVTRQVYDGPKPYADVVLSHGPVGYWRLGESSGTVAVDSSGNGRDGTHEGSPTLGVEGALISDDDTAVRFDGGGTQYGKVDAFPSSADFSADCWVYVDAAGDAAQGFMERTAGTTTNTDWLLYLETAGGHAKWRVAQDDGTLVTVPAGVDLARDTWHHVAGTCSGGVARLYVDGSEVASRAVTRTTAKAAGNLYLARLASATAYALLGTLDEPAVYDRALTAAEVKEHYDAGRGRIPTYRTETTREPVVDEARFYAGVYVLTTPDTQHGRTPLVRTVMGRNLLHLLDRNVPDTYVLDPNPTGPTPNITYLDALRKVVADAGLTIPVRLDGTRQDAVLPKARVWCVGATTWLDIANDLMSEIAYVDLWNNEIGEYRAQPVVPLADRPPEHRFDTADMFTDLVGAGYTETEEKAGAYNLWRFVRADMAYQPVEGDGLFIYPPTNRPTGADARPAPLQVIDAADQAALEAEGLRIVAADQRTERTFAGMVDPFPIAGHRDVVEFVSAGRLFKMQVTSYLLTPYSKGQWVLGGGTGGEVRERPETRTTATVTQATPLRVVVDGASTGSPAKALDGATYAVGERPTVIVRNPRQPLVQGKEA
jgi:hypothetical protein